MKSPADLAYKRLAIVNIAFYGLAGAGDRLRPLPIGANLVFALFT